MIDNILHSIGITLLAIVSWFGAGSTIGVSNAIPTPIALFETSLASAITSSDTSMTLTSATDKAGTTLASSTYAFVIDGGTSVEEMVVADCTATACTNMTRGLSPITGTTTVASLQFAHRRGSSVKITDGPQLLILSRMANGNAGFPNIIKYNSNPTFTSGTAGETQIVTKKYTDDLAIAGSPDMSATTKGIGEKATGAEAAAGAADGSGNTTAPLVLTTSIATSTCQTTGNYVLVASSTTGKLDKGCFDQTLSYNFTATTTFATSTIASTTITNLNVTNISGAAKNADVQTFTSSGTWTKPTVGTPLRVLVQLWGAGGGGGSQDTNSGGQGGGGGGAYKEMWFAASALASTASSTVGAAGAGATGGTNNATAGGNSCFSTLASCGGTVYATAYGGGYAFSGGATHSGGGGGGGASSVGGNSTDGTGATGGGPAGSAANTSHGGFGGAGGGTAANGAGGSAAYGGGGGGAGGANLDAGGAGGSSIWGGGGGGGCGTAAAPAAGTSEFGGAGGQGVVDGTGNAGTQPGGGGGAGCRSSGGPYNGGNGGAGKVVITTFF